MKIPIIYEDKNVLVVNKPAGIVVHPDTKHKTETLIQQMLEKYPEIKDVGDPSTSSGQVNLRPGIVHRLDKETSGVLVIAKNQKSFEFLKNQFKDKKIQKTYVALVKGNVKNKAGTINAPVKLFTKSREAETGYRVIERYNDYTLLEIYPKTGRTHQIRIHMKSMGHPLVCDKLYGGKNPECPHGLNRHFLHAKSIELMLPNNSRIKLEADPPDDLQEVLTMLKRES